MQLHEVKDVVETSDPNEVEDLIQGGWTLVAVVAGNRWVSGQQEIGPIYVLGR